MTNAVDSVVLALVSAFGAALPGVAVVDGPRPMGPGDTELVLVAHDATPDADTVITIQQEPASLGGTDRYERGSIPCCVMAQTGDADVPGRRQRAMELLATCETTMRANRTLGGVVMTSQFASGEVHQFQNDLGSAVVAQFEITYMAQV
jgi:hypothetical protein